MSSATISFSTLKVNKKINSVASSSPQNVASDHSVV